MPDGNLATPEGGIRQRINFSGVLVVLESERGRLVCKSSHAEMNTWEIGTRKAKIMSAEIRNMEGTIV